MAYCPKHERGTSVPRFFWDFSNDSNPPAWLLSYRLLQLCKDIHIREEGMKTKKLLANLHTLLVSQKPTLHAVLANFVFSEIV